MKLARNIAIVALVGAATAVPAGASTPTGATTARTPHFEGTVVSVDRSAKTFRLRDAERGTVRIKVTSSTSFQRIAGFSALRRGMKRVEATVRGSGGAWIAIRVQRN